MADELADMFDLPEEPPGKQRTITEEFLAIVDDFSDYIEKFMFEIVTFLAVIDSSMGLMKDVLGLFGFEGWRMSFFPTFSFIVTMSVFLFGSKKRKTKRETEQAGGLGQALEMFEDVMDVMDDVVSVVEELDEDDKKGEGDPEGECGGNDGQEEGEPDDNVSVNENKAKIRKVLGVVMLVGGIVAKLRKRDKEANETANETGEVKSQTPDVLNSANCPEAASSSSFSFRNTLVQTGVPVGLAALNTCVATTNITTTTSTTCVNGQRAFREINEVAAVARRETTSTTQEAWENSLRAARNAEQAVVRLTDTTEKKALEVGEAVGQEASQFQDSLTLGASDMAGNMAQGTAELAGSLTAGAGKAAAQGAQKSGGLIPLVVRMVRIVVRLANRGKGKEPKTEVDAESSTKETNNEEGSIDAKEQHGGMGNIRGSLTSINYDRESLYYDCESQFTTIEMQTSVSPLRAVSRRSIVSTCTQTDGESNWSVFSPWQSQARLQELESRVLELEAERNKTRSSQVILGDITCSTNIVKEESQRLTRPQTSDGPKSDKRTTENQDLNFKSSISDKRSAAVSKVENESSRLQHQRQIPSSSGLIDHKLPRSRSVRRSGKNDRFNVDSPVVVHYENAQVPHGTEFLSSVTREDLSGRTCRRDCGESQARFSNEAETNVSSTEDLEVGHSYTERSALSLSSVRFIDEVPRRETTRDFSHRKKRPDDALKMTHRNSKRLRAKEKHQFYVQPSHHTPESRRLPRNQLFANSHKWNSDKWTSDICLTGRKHSPKNKFVSGKDQTRERYSSEWNLRRESEVYSRQPTHSSGMTRSPSTLQRSQSSCFGDDESF